MANLIDDDDHNTFDEYGRDGASGCDYRVTVVTTEVDPVAVDPTAPLNGLLLNFRYRFFNDQYCHATSWYNLEFSGRITEHIHRDALSAFLDARSVPLAARDDALRHIFNMYGGFGLIESIQATVRIYAYNYMPFNHIYNMYDGFGLVDEDVFLGLDEDGSDRAMEMSDEDFLGPKPASREVVEALEKVTVWAETTETRCAVCLEGLRLRRCPAPTLFTEIASLDGLSIGTSAHCVVSSFPPLADRSNRPDNL